MRSWKILVPLIIVVCVVLGMKFFGRDGPTFEIAEAEVHTGPITFAIETAGTLAPLSTITVGCETTGKIIEILVDYDEAVQKDQVICRIDPELVDAQHQQSIAELARASSALEEAKIAEAE